MLSAPILGLLLIPLSIYVPPKQIIITTMVLGMAHRVAPMMLVAMYPEIRQRARRAPWQFLVLPAGILVLCGSVGWFFPSRVAIPLDAITAQTLKIVNVKQPLWVLTMILTVWNAYHFAMQDFGVLSIYRRKNGIGIRGLDKWLCLLMGPIVSVVPFVMQFNSIPVEYLRWASLGIAVAATGVFFLLDRRISLRAAFIVPVFFTPAAMFWYTHEMYLATNAVRWLHIPLWPLMWVFVLSQVQHYLVAVGLSSHVWSRRTGRSYWWFVLLLLVGGFALCAVLFVDPHTAALRANPFVIGLLVGISFVHFLYEGWWWKLSNPEVRATIGRDLFAHA